MGVARARLYYHTIYQSANLTTSKALKSHYLMAFEVERSVEEWGLPELCIGAACTMATFTCTHKSLLQQPALVQLCAASTSPALWVLRAASTSPALWVLRAAGLELAMQAFDQTKCLRWGDTQSFGCNECQAQVSE